MGLNAKIAKGSKGEGRGTERRGREGHAEDAEKRGMKGKIRLQLRVSRAPGG